VGVPSPAPREKEIKMWIEIKQKLQDYESFKGLMSEEDHKSFKVGSVHDVSKKLGGFLVKNKFAEETAEPPKEKKTAPKGYYVKEPFSVQNNKLLPGHKLTDEQIERKKSNNGRRPWRIKINQNTGL
jgi:hypothetical protein